MGAVGFEPTKHEAAALQAASFDHSENTPLVRILLVGQDEFFIFR